MDKRLEAAIANERPIRSGQIQDPYGTQPVSTPARDVDERRDDLGPDADPNPGDAEPPSDPPGDVEG
jgi:hypothetical protein